MGKKSKSSPPPPPAAAAPCTPLSIAKNGSILVKIAAKPGAKMSTVTHYSQVIIKVVLDFGWRYLYNFDILVPTPRTVLV